MSAHVKSKMEDVNMLKIRLFCANGMSTSLLVKKMEEAAAEKGKEVDIKAYPILDMERLGGKPMWLFWVPR